MYKSLKTENIVLEAKEEAYYDAGDGVVFVPHWNSKIYLHWLTDTGKIMTTHTMTYATKVTGKLKLINGQINPTSIQVIHLD